MALFDRGYLTMIKSQEDMDNQTTVNNCLCSAQHGSRLSA
jgi:hypothetical protein